MILVVLAVDVAYVALVFATGDDPEPEEPDVETTYGGPMHKGWKRNQS